MKKAKKELLLNIKNVTKKFGEKQVLSDISFEIDKEQIVTIIGPNGAGKTTLVKILTGVIPYDSGEIVKAKDLKIAYLAQNSSVNDSMPMTVNRFLSLSGNRDEKQRQDCLKLLQIENLQYADFSALSGGQVQRVLLCRCLLRNPNLLILDEPTQSLDFKGRVYFYHLLGEIRDLYHCAILIISHDLHLVMAKAEEIICLNHHICCKGKPEKIKSSRAYLDLFPESYGEDVALYAHHHNHEHSLNEGGCF